MRFVIVDAVQVQRVTVSVTVTHAAVLIALSSPETPKLVVMRELLRDKGPEGQMKCFLCSHLGGDP